MFDAPRWHALRAALGQDSGRRGVTLVLLLLVGVSALAWAGALWRAWSVLPPEPSPRAAPAEVSLPSAQALGQWLGAGPAAEAPGPAQRFQLLGIVAGTRGGGAALIAVDGQPARPFAVGAQLAPGFVLQRLAVREAVLAEAMDGPPRLVLPLPAWEPRSAAAAPTAPVAPIAPGPASAPAEETAPADAGSAAPVRRGDQR